MNDGHLPGGRAHEAERCGQPGAETSEGIYEVALHVRPKLTEGRMFGLVKKRAVDRSMTTMKLAQLAGATPEGTERVLVRLANGFPWIRQTSPGRWKYRGFQLLQMADTQHMRVYEAGWTEEVRSLSRRQFSGPAGVQAYVDDIMRSRWRRDHFSHQRIVVQEDDLPAGVRAQARTRYPSMAIILPRREPVSDLTVLHELAHCLTQFRATSHGPEFARANLLLVGCALGEVAAQRLAEAYLRHRVEVAPVIVHRCRSCQTLARDVGALGSRRLATAA
jgi:putative metallohydrolase (TIGR04338 family)